MKVVKYSSFIIIPLLLLALLLTFHEVRGPYYLHCNSDPTYYYLINCLNVAIFEWPHHVDNPGSTVQIIGGVTIRVCGFFRGVENLETDVLLNPEFYLNAINKVLAVLNLVALFFLGCIAFKLTGSLLYGYLLQLIPFVSWQETLRSFIKVTPESMVFFSGIFLVILLLVIVQRDDLQKQKRLYTLLFSLVIAFGLASKLTFIPIIAIPLIIIPGLRWKLYFVGLTIILFHIMIIPAWGYYGYLVEWAEVIFIHSGHYGTGKANLIDLNAAFQHLKDLIYRYHTYLILVLFTVLYVLAIQFKSNLRSRLKKDIRYKVLIAITTTVLLQVLMVLKHYDTHYLLPAFMLTTILIYLIIQLSRTVKESINLRPNNPVLKGFMLLLLCACWYFIKPVTDWMRDYLWATPVGNFLNIILIIGGALLLLKIFLPKLNPYLNVTLLILLVVYHLRYIDIPEHLAVFQETQEEVKKFADVLESKPYSDKTKVFMCCSSSKYTALWMGGSINFPQIALYRKLADIYKDEHVYFLDFRNDTAYAVSWTGELMRFDRFLNDQGSVIVNGNNFNLTPQNMSRLEKTAGVKPQVVLKSTRHGESIYLMEKVEKPKEL